MGDIIDMQGPHRRSLRPEERRAGLDSQRGAVSPLAPSPPARSLGALSVSYPAG